APLTRNTPAMRREGPGCARASSARSRHFLRNDLRPHPEEGAQRPSRRMGAAHASRRRLSPPPQHEAEYRPCGRRTPNTTPAPRHREPGADFKHTIREGNDAQLTLSAATAARRRFIGSTTTLAPT